MDELKEELEEAAVRAEAVLIRDRKQFADATASMKKRRDSMQKAEAKRKADADRDAEIRKINAEIDARIKAESQPVEKIKK